MQPLRPPASADGAFVRVRTLGFAVEYAGIRVREGSRCGARLWHGHIA